MFIIRTAFWIGVIFLILPSNQESQTKVFNAASAVAKDIATFCDRNGDVCEQGAEYWQHLQNKAETGGKMISGIVNHFRSGEMQPTNALHIEEQGSQGGAGQPVAPITQSQVQNTLTADDMGVAWQAPQARGAI